MQGWTCSLLHQRDHPQASLDDDNHVNTILKGTTFSSTNVCMKISNSTYKERNKTKTLVILHKQAKIWANYNYKFVPWAFFCCK
jgi:hypothetical protein